MNSNKLVNMIITAAVVAAGVIAGGYLMKWGADNDVAFLSNARDGFDS